MRESEGRSDEPLLEPSSLLPEERLDCIRARHLEQDLAEAEFADFADGGLEPSLQEALELSVLLDERLADVLRGDTAPAPPAGLQQRLEQQLGLADAASGEAVAEADADAAQVEIADPVESASHTDRRWFGWGAVAVTVAALWFGIVWIATPGSLTSKDLVSEAQQWAQTWGEATEGLEWQQTMPPSSHPIAAMVQMDLSTPWRTVSLLGDDAATVYRAPTATLVVLQTERQITGLGSMPPMVPAAHAITGSRRIAAWQSDDLVYVLIVDGDLRRYQQLLRRPNDA